jgi:hypothetical protein
MRCSCRVTALPAHRHRLHLHPHPFSRLPAYTNTDSLTALSLPSPPRTPMRYSLSGSRNCTSRPFL